MKTIEPPAMSSVDARRLKKLVEEMGQCRSLIGNVAQAANQQFIDIDNQMARFGAILDVLTELVGADKVQAALDSRAIAQATAEAENAKAQLAEAVANGDLVPTETIAPDSIVVGEQVDADGNSVAPGYCQFALNRSPEWLAGLLGKAVGAQIESPNKTFVKVTAVYEVAAHPVGDQVPDATAAQPAEAPPAEMPAPVSAPAVEG